MPGKDEMIFRTFRTEVKEVDDKEGIIDMLIPMSTSKVDRHGESIDPMGWANSLSDFQKRAILISSHSYNDLRKQIGEFLQMKITKKGLFAKPKYYINQGNEEADWGFKLASKGMAAFSVGFIPVKWTDDDKADGKKKPKRTYIEQELLEISHVILPANRDAIQELQGKSEDPIINRIINDVLEEEGFIEIEEEKAKYNCECIKCGHKLTSDKHCKELKCPKCGGTMRRVERPGPGEETNMEEDVINKPEDTDDSIRIPVKGEEGKHKGHKIRWMTVSIKEGIRGIYCIDCKKIITYVFDKKKGWTMEKAKKWMTEHGKIVCDYFEKMDWDVLGGAEPGEINWEHFKASMEMDEKEKDDEDEKDLEMNDLINRICEINIENKELKEKLKDFELKAGAVLNAKNKKNLKDAQALIQAVLDSAATGEEDSLEIEDEKDNKGDDTVINLEDNEGDDKRKDEKDDKELIEVDEKVIAEVIAKQMNYTVGKLDKSNT